MVQISVVSSVPRREILFFFNSFVLTFFYSCDSHDSCQESILFFLSTKGDLEVRASSDGITVMVSVWIVGEHYCSLRRRLFSLTLEISILRGVATAWFTERATKLEPCTVTR